MSSLPVTPRNFECIHPATPLECLFQKILSFRSSIFILEICDCLAACFKYVPFFCFKYILLF